MEAVVARHVDEARDVSELDVEAEILGMKREIKVNAKAVEFAVRQEVARETEGEAAGDD